MATVSPWGRSLAASEDISRDDLDDRGRDARGIQVVCVECSHWPEEHVDGGECEAPGCACLVFTAS